LDHSADPEMNKLVPDNMKNPFDVTKVIARLVDGGDYLEVMQEFAKNIVICFARIQGIVVGIIANQPAVKAGTLDIDASDKSARFIRFCNVFNIPIVTLVDVPGFMPGVQQERGGIIRHGAKMLFAYASATVPKITVIMRKAYGGAYLAMCSSDMGADAVYAWPSAEIAVMGADGAVKVLFKKEIAAAVDPKKEEGPFVDDQGKEALNFQITVLIASIVFALLGHVICILTVLTPVPWMAGIVFALIGATKANEGIAYRYPFRLRLIR